MEEILDLTECRMNFMKIVDDGTGRSVTCGLSDCSTALDSAAGGDLSLERPVEW
jgi:hypothetical protein